MRRYAPIIVLMMIVMASSGCVVYQTAPVYGHEPPPRVVVSQPEYLYIIPSFGVYFVPNISTEVFFVNGRWYYTLRGAWYWGTSYSGPWTYISVRHVPTHLRKLPRDYRTRYHNDYYRVPYGHWKKRHKALPPKAGYKPPTHVRKYKGKVYGHPRDRDVVFHDGYWYRRYNGLWYQGKSSTGPWRYPETGFLPKAVKKLPPGYWQPKSNKPHEVVPWPKVQKKYRKKIESSHQQWGFQR